LRRSAPSPHRNSWDAALFSLIWQLIGHETWRCCETPVGMDAVLWPLEANECKGRWGNPAHVMFARKLNLSLSFLDPVLLTSHLYRHTVQTFADKNTQSPGDETSYGRTLDRTVVSNDPPTTAPSMFPNPAGRRWLGKMSKTEYINSFQFSLKVLGYRVGITKNRTI
jgi:hypothetical protein